MCGRVGYDLHLSSVAAVEPGCFLLLLVFFSGGTHRTPLCLSKASQSRQMAAQPDLLLLEVSAIKKKVVPDQVLAHGGSVG